MLSFARPKYSSAGASVEVLPACGEGEGERTVPAATLVSKTHNAAMSQTILGFGRTDLYLSLPAAPFLHEAQSWEKN